MPETSGLASHGEVFLDARGSGRALRLTWHHDADVVVLSMWRGQMCSATFRLNRADVSDFVDALVEGLDSRPNPSTDSVGEPVRTGAIDDAWRQAALAQSSPARNSPAPTPTARVPGPRHAAPPSQPPQPNPYPPPYAGPPPQYADAPSPYTGPPPPPPQYAGPPSPYTGPPPQNAGPPPQYAGPPSPYTGPPPPPPNPSGGDPSGDDPSGDDAASLSDWLFRGQRNAG